MLLKKVPFDTPLPLFYVGPDLEEGPLPCFIYLALSAKEALLTPPYNQPASLLEGQKIRILSVDLPYHGENLPAIDAIGHWAPHFEKGEDILSPFLEKLEESLQIFFEHTKTGSVGIAGLSRGAFFASHIAARIPLIKTLLAFAPLTRLDFLKEFRSIKDSEIIKPLELSLISSILSEKKIRIYIGNHDERVSTDFCYAWMRDLVEQAISQKIRSPQIELFIKPSIGLFGHGTSPESFEKGTKWMAKQLQVVL